MLWVIRIVVTTLCLWFIIHKLKNTAFPPGTLVFRAEQFRWIWVVIGLMPLNWLLEVHKWRLSVPYEHLTFGQSIRSVLSGLALNWIVPFTLGDVGARLANVKRMKQSGAALLAVRTVSMLVTVVYGGCALIFYFKYPTWAYWLVLLVGIPALAMGFRIYGFKERIYYQVVGLSIVRYLVFTSQFVLLIWVFNPGLSWSVILLGVGWIFFFRSIVPSLFGNFGVREASALVFFEPYLTSPVHILTPTLIIWLINTVIPSVIGAFFIFKLKLKIAQ